MIRRSNIMTDQYLRIPRESGDDPDVAVLGLEQVVYSPRERG